MSNLSVTGSNMVGLLIDALLRNGEQRYVRDRILFVGRHLLNRSGETRYKKISDETSERFVEVWKEVEQHLNEINFMYKPIKVRGDFIRKFSNWKTYKEGSPVVIPHIDEKTGVCYFPDDDEEENCSKYLPAAHNPTQGVVMVPPYFQMETCPLVRAHMDYSKRRAESHGNTHNRTVTNDFRHGHLKNADDAFELAVQVRPPQDFERQLPIFRPPEITKESDES
jgi:hypothetical protein